jgi:two-component system, OmpR family, response regulator ChvI
LAPKKVLIVDDEPDITFTLKKGLEQGGYDVHVFNDPLMALSNFKPDVYDLLLLDIKMPKMTGFELYRKLKEMDSKVKVCFITAFETYYEKFRQEFYPLEEIKDSLENPYK